MTLMSPVSRTKGSLLQPLQSLLKSNIVFPIAGFAGVIVLWWVIALFRHEMMPTPPEALAKNLDFILHPFYRRGPGDLGLGWLLLASLRRVCIGFLLEKPNLTVGFVPVNDCAPFAIAWEKGFFRKYGLNVTLSREASWGNSRDGIIFGRLDASPVVSGAVTNARTGAEGARQFPSAPR